MWDLTDYTVAPFVFHRVLGLIYLAAFLSLLPQLQGIYGKNGISSIRDYLRHLQRRLSRRRYYLVPSIFWIGAGDAMLYGVCGAGILASIALTLNLLPTLMLVVLWIAYLSFVSTGREFFSYQWDTLLLEVGFAAIFLPHPFFVIVFWALLFRLTFMSGVVKLLSGDPSWRNLTALNYHYWTQPLPTPPAWYMNRLPSWFHKACCAVTLAIEVVVPFLIFGPPTLQLAACVLLILLQLAILLTGNYCFFNLLTIALCLFLIPDSFWPVSVSYPASSASIWVTLVGGVLLLLGALQVIGMFDPRLKPRVPFFLVNPYGLFAYMTKERPEILIEASEDGFHWSGYGFRYKPDAIDRAPRFNLPHQPRIDWQLWFLALRPFPEAWFLRMLERLLRREPSVERLFRTIPYTEPRYIRALIYDYRFGETTWWTRTFDREMLQPLEWDDFPRPRL